MATLEDQAEDTRRALGHYPEKVREYVEKVSGYSYGTIEICNACCSMRLVSNTPSDGLRLTVSQSGSAYCSTCYSLEIATPQVFQTMRRTTGFFLVFLGIE